MKPENSKFNLFSDFVNFCKKNKFLFNPSISESISEDIGFYKKGNKIHIKKENKGKFTESANRSGMGIQEFASHILNNKDKYSSTLIKRANFAKNASKWKHKG